MANEASVSGKNDISFQLCQFKIIASDWKFKIISHSQKSCLQVHREYLAYFSILILEMDISLDISFTDQYWINITIKKHGQQASFITKGKRKHPISIKKHKYMV